MLFLAAAVGPGAANAWSMLDSLGLAVALSSLLFEASADAQMAAFKATSAKSDTVMNCGLWRHSRLQRLWQELPVVGHSLDGVVGWRSWALLSPEVITFLVLKVLGANLQEPHQKTRGIASTDYMRRTSTFLPLPPRPVDAN